jgi:hypothetical protein
LAIAGPGRFSVDAAVGGADWGVAWPIVAILLGIASGCVLLTERRRELAREVTEEEEPYEEERRAA